MGASSVAVSNQGIVDAATGVVDQSAAAQALASGSYVFYQDATAAAIGIQTAAPGADKFTRLSECEAACSDDNAVSSRRERQHVAVQFCVACRASPLHSTTEPGAASSLPVVHVAQCSGGCGHYFWRAEVPCAASAASALPQCAAFVLDSTVSLAARPATCKLVKGNPSAGVFRRSLIRADINRLEVPAALLG